MYEFYWVVIQKQRAILADSGSVKGLIRLRGQTLGRNQPGGGSAAPCSSWATSPRARDRSGRAPGRSRAGCPCTRRASRAGGLGIVRPGSAEECFDQLLGTVRSILPLIRAEQSRSLLLVTLYGCTNCCLDYEQAHAAVDPWRGEQPLKKSKAQLLRRLDDYDCWLGHRRVERMK